MDGTTRDEMLGWYGRQLAPVLAGLRAMGMPR